MFSDEIVDLCISNAETYYNYLKEHKEDSQRRIGVKKNVCSEDRSSNIELHLKERLYNTEDLLFSVGDALYTSSEIRPVNYSNTCKILYISPKDELKSVLLNCAVGECFILSDTLYLIKRYIDWYKKQKETLWVPALPSKRPCFSHSIFECSSDRDFSEEQFECIKTALTSPISYIWGAPGTGKTRYVLSECVLKYLGNAVIENSYILICAPTNVALEQTLYGILEVIKEMDVPLNRILRLGIPSDDFSAAYPEVCEIAGIEQALFILRQERDDLMSEYRRAEMLSRKIVLLGELQSTFEKLKCSFEISNESQNIRKQALETIRKECAQLERSETQIDTELCPILAEHAITEKKMKEPKAFISRMFKGGYYEELTAKLGVERSMISMLRTKHEETSGKKEKLIAEIHSIEKKLNDNTEEKSLKTDMHKVLSNFNLEFPGTFDIHSMMKLDTAEYIENVTLRVSEMMSKTGEESANIEPIYIIQEKIAKIDKKLDACEKNDVSHRMEKAGIIAVTADSFVARFSLFSECKKQPVHIFLDEAGYCSLEKTLPLLYFNCPLTLLGDHLQLPPINTVPSGLKNDTVLWSLPSIYCEDLFDLYFEELLLKFQKLAPPSFLDMPYKALTATYRFGSNISDILSEFIYTECGFQSAENASKTKIVVIDCKYKRAPSPNKPGEFLKKGNLGEVNGICKYIQQYRPEDFAVLSPYRNQTALLDSCLKKAGFDTDDRVLTVHKSQGREWDTVILSISDAESCNKVFTSTHISCFGKPVLNTAISRAKKTIVLACDVKFWKQYPNEMITRIVDCADEVLSYD